MKKDRKLFSKGEKTVISFLAIIIIMLSFQVASLLSDKKDEARATTEHEMMSARVTESKQQVEQSESVEEPSVEGTEQLEEQHEEDDMTSSQEDLSNDEELDKHKVSEEERVEANGNKQATDEKVAYLTIDDGPTEVDDDILDLLAEYDAKATFFMLEPPMRNHPDVVKRIVDEGHVPALHGVTHDANKFYRSTQSVLDEMERAQQTLEDITGVKATLIRTPYGSSPNMTDTYKQAVKENGYQLWDWNVDSLDWKLTNGEYVQHAIQQIEKVASKGEAPVILIHSRETTLEHLPKLLDYLVKQGYTLEGLDESMEPYILP